MIQNLLKCLLCIISLCILLPQKATAQEAATLMIVKEDTSARETADSSSEEVFALKKGDSIMAGEQTDTNWYVFVKDGKQAYIEASKVEEAKADEKLVEELKVLSAETEKDIIAVNQYREEAARSKIWGIIVVILIIAIFGVGLYSTLKKKNTKA